MATNRLYRSRHGKIFGVCQGLADWKDLPADTLRVIVGISILVTGVFPGILIYAVIGLLLPLEPVRSRSSYTYRESTGENTRYTAKENLRETFERLKRKVEDMEETVFDKERDWDERFREDNDK